MLLSFELSMPNSPVRWSGQDNLYAKVVNFRSHQKQARSILEAGSFYHNFGDGWGASVSVKQVTGREAAKIRRKSKGFCGYDWMIESIEKHGDIRTD